jgi:hypothetical protein
MRQSDHVGCDALRQPSRPHRVDRIQSRCVPLDGFRRFRLHDLSELAFGGHEARQSIRHVAAIDFVAPVNAKVVGFGVGHARNVVADLNIKVREVLDIGARLLSVLSSTFDDKSREWPVRPNRPISLPLASTSTKMKMRCDPLPRFGEVALAPMIHAQTPYVVSEFRRGTYLLVALAHLGEQAHRQLVATVVCRLPRGLDVSLPEENIDQDGMLLT